MKCLKRSLCVSNSIEFPFSTIIIHAHLNWRNIFCFVVVLFFSFIDTGAIKADILSRLFADVLVFVLPLRPKLRCRGHYSNVGYPEFLGVSALLLSVMNTINDIFTLESWKVPIKSTMNISSYHQIVPHTLYLFVLLVWFCLFTTVCWSFVFLFVCPVYWRFFVCLFVCLFVFVVVVAFYNN